MIARGTVVVMAKEPIPGRVKTRLCPPFTLTDAARLAAAALDDTLAAVAATGCARRVLALEGAPGSWIPRGFVVVPQSGGGLDGRIGAVLAQSSGPTLVIGMDTPQVTSALLEHAFAGLQRGAGAVVGPACDGGYWLLGLAEPRADAVVGVPMSTAHTGAAQLARLVALGVNTVTIATLRDVDTADDAVEVATIARDTRFAEAFRRRSAALTRSRVPG